jgi:hypothetical protein
MCCFAPPHAREVCNVHYMTGAASVLSASWDGSVRVYDESGTAAGVAQTDRRGSESATNFCEYFALSLHVHH